MSNTCRFCESTIDSDHPTGVCEGCVSTYITTLETENVRLKEELAVAQADYEDALNTLLEVQELVETRHAQLTNTERVLEYERELREEARATFSGEESPE